ncbi:MAG: glycosyltransferase family 39 protein [Chloroflexota bacterium]
MPQSRFPYRSLMIILAVTLIARLILLASGAVSFHADEAVVGLMARHILTGDRPTFFYGQAYMGSLDAWFIALGFRILGDSVLTIRIVQSALYVLVVAVGYVLAWRLSGRTMIANIAGLVMAVPPVNTVLYTTATLGGYNETLVFGTLILLMAYEVTHDFPGSRWRWALLGLCAGLGWWTNGLIAVYVLPAGLLILYRLLRGKILGARHVVPLLAIALVFFFVGSAPWWIFDFSHNHAALSTFINSRQTGEFAGIGLPYVPPGQRAIGLVLIGLPALIGLRFPWSSSYFLLPVGLIVLLIYIVAIMRLLRGHNPLKPDARGLMLGMLGLFCVVFVASTFGADPTGRYFLPLLLPLGIILGALVASFQSPVTRSQLSEHGTQDVELSPDSALSTQHSVLSSLMPRASLLIPLLVLGYHAAGQISATTTPLGLTTQFDLASHIPNDHDAELIAFLDEHQLYNGYTNYWVAFRLAFLSNERMQYSAALPYKTTLDYNPADNRYPPYVEATDAAAHVAVITTNLPELDSRLIAGWQLQKMTYQETTIGAFHIYYDFAPMLPRPPLFE